MHDQIVASPSVLYDMPIVVDQTLPAVPSADVLALDQPLMELMRDGNTIAIVEPLHPEDL